MDYKRMYHILVAGAEKAIAALKEQNYGLARDFLIQAEQEAEEIYLESEEKRE